MNTEIMDRIQDVKQGILTLWNEHRPLSNQDRKRILSVDHTHLLVLRGKRVVRSVDSASRRAVILQYRLLDELLKENRDTEYGQKYGFGEIHGVQEYKEKVPLSEYDDYVPYIRRMMDGEQNVLSAKPPKYFAMSSGSVGVPKYVPVSHE